MICRRAAEAALSSVMVLQMYRIAQKEVIAVCLINAPQMD